MPQSDILQFTAENREHIHMLKRYRLIQNRFLNKFHVYTLMLDPERLTVDNILPLLDKMDQNPKIAGCP